MKKAQEAIPSHGDQALAYLAAQRGEDFFAVDVTFDGMFRSSDRAA
jgi:hypothetical protein